MSRPHADLIAQSRWLASLDADLSAELLAATRLSRLGDGTAIYRQGDQSDGLYGVLQGTVRLVCYSEHGAAQIHLLARRGDWFGEVATLDGEPRQQSAICDGAVEVLHVALSELERLEQVLPKIWRAIGCLASWHQRDALQYIQTIVALPSEERILGLLSSLEVAAPGTEHRITHEEIAANIGLSRQTVTTVLRRLQKQGVVRLGYRSISLSGNRNRPGF